MADLLLVLLELFFDFLIEFGGEALLDLLSRAAAGFGMALIRVVRAS